MLHFSSPIETLKLNIRGNILSIWLMEIKLFNKIFIQPISINRVFKYILPFENQKSKVGSRFIPKYKSDENCYNIGIIQFQSYLYLKFAIKQIPKK